MIKKILEKNRIQSEFLQINIALEVIKITLRQKIQHVSLVTTCLIQKQTKGFFFVIFVFLFLFLFFIPSRIEMIGIIMIMIWQVFIY